MPAAVADTVVATTASLPAWHAGTGGGERVQRWDRIAPPVAPAPQREWRRAAIPDAAAATDRQDIRHNRARRPGYDPILRRYGVASGRSEQTSTLIRSTATRSYDVVAGAAPPEEKPGGGAVGLGIGLHAEAAAEGVRVKLRALAKDEDVTSACALVSDARAAAALADHDILQQIERTLFYDPDALNKVISLRNLVDDAIAAVGASADGLEAQVEAFIDDGAAAVVSMGSSGLATRLMAEIEDVQGQRKELMKAAAAATWEMKRLNGQLDDQRRLHAEAAAVRDARRDRIRLLTRDLTAMCSAFSTELRHVESMLSREVDVRFAQEKALDEHRKETKGIVARLEAQLEAAALEAAQTQARMGSAIRRMQQQGDDAHSDAMAELMVVQRGRDKHLGELNHEVDRLKKVIEIAGSQGSSSDAESQVNLRRALFFESLKRPGGKPKSSSLSWRSSFDTVQF